MTDCKKIAIIGWGSLIWDPRDLKNRYTGNWQTGGPCLPIEFSRVSQDCRLTLVIDETNNETIPTRFVTSLRSNLHDAIADLRDREGTVCENIGFVDMQETKVPPVSFLQSDVIREWARCNEFNAVVWTALKPNFEKQTGAAFSVEEATQYIQNLPKSAKKVAMEYIEKAPTEVCTPLRRHLYTTDQLKR